jgi:hypothetical protein
MRPRLGTDIISATCTSRPERKPQMRQIRHTRRRPGPASEQQSPLPADPRDPDIVHAHQVARRTSRSRARRAQPDRRAQPTLIPGSR